MKDLLGNVLAEGSMVLWRDNGLIGRVVNVCDSELTVSKDGQKKPPTVTLQFELCVPKGQTPPFFVLVDPAASIIVDKLLKES